MAFYFALSRLVFYFYSIQKTDGAPYPVMVWFYGGGFQGGANIQYPGHFLAAKGAIVVVPNYRLNVIGNDLTSF